MENIFCFRKGLRGGRERQLQRLKGKWECRIKEELICMAIKGMGDG